MKISEIKIKYLKKGVLNVSGILGNHSYIDGFKMIVTPHGEDFDLLIPQNGLYIFPFNQTIKEEMLNSVRMGCLDYIEKRGFSTRNLNQLFYRRKSNE